MQKKLLLSLLLSVPTAQIALANISLDSLKDPSKWTASGIGGADFTFNEADNSVNAGIGTGVISRTVTGLPAGSYKLTFGDSSNIKVSVNGKALTLADGGYLFTIDAAGSALIEISAANDAAPFSFAKALLSFSQNFAEESAELTAQLGEAEFATIDEGVSAAVKTALEAEKTEILKGKTAIETILTSMAGEDKDTYDQAITVDAFIKIYQKYDLANGFQQIIDQIEAYAAQVEAWNKKVANANQEAVLLAEVKTLSDKVDALLARINGKDTPAFAKDLDLEPTQTFKTKVTEFGKQLDAAFDTLQTDKEIEAFETAIADLNEEFDGLEAQFDSDLADYNVWVEINADFKTLDKDYLTAQSTIAAYTGVYTEKDETYRTVYSDVQTKWLTDITEAYNKAKDTGKDNYNADAPTRGLSSAKVKGTDGKETNELVADAIKNAIAAAETTIENTVTTSGELVENQNEQYNLAMGEDGIVPSLQTQYDELASLEIPASAPKDLQDKLAAAKEALEALNAFVDEHYRAHDLNVEAAGFTALTTDLQTSLDNLEKYRDGLVAVTDLQTRFDKVKKDIKAAYVGYKIPADVFDLDAKMKTTYDDIQAAINGISFAQDGTVNSEEVTNVGNAIDNLEETGMALVNAFGPVYTSIHALEAALPDYKKFVDEKLVVLDCITDTKKVDMSGYNTFTKNVEDFLKDLTAAGQANGQQIFDLANGVNTAWNEAYGEGDGWKTKLADKKLSFAGDVTNLNSDTVANYIVMIEKKVPTIDFTKVKENLAAINADITAATTTAAYATCDTKLQTLANSLVKLNALVPNFSDIQESIDKLTTDNEANSIGTGLTYFEGVIAGIQESYDKLLADITKAIGEGKFDAQYSTFQGSINTLKTTIAQTAQAIVDNNTYHANQLAESTSVRSAIQDIITEVSKGDAGIVEEWIAALNTLQQKDLISNDLVVADAYGKGESKKQDTAITDEYARILAAAQEILGQYKGDYGQAVIDANNQFLKDLKWDSILDNLYKEYLSAIGEYNNYIYGLHNPGYKAAVLEAIGDHEKLYKYAELITALRTQASACVSKANTEGKVLTENTFTAPQAAQTFLEMAADYLQTMQDDVVAMNATVQQVAQTYYADNYASLSASIATAGTTMANEGITKKISDDTLKEANDNLKKAKDLYDAIVADNDKAAADNKYTPKYEVLGLAMDNVADILDQVAETVSLQKAAQQQWDLSYGAATKRIAELQKSLNAFIASVDEDKKEDAENLNTQFNNIVDQISALNTSVLDTKTGLINGFKANYLDPLAGYMADLEKLVAAGDTQQDLEQAVLDFNNDLSALKAYIAAYSSTYEMTVTDIETLIANFKTQVNAPASLNNGAALVTMKNNIQAAIEAKYADAAQAEWNSLSGWSYKLHIAYNDAAKNGKFTSEELVKMNETIDGYAVAIGELSKPWVSTAASNDASADKGYTYKTREEYQDAVLALLAEMTTMYQTLQASWTTSPVATSVSELEDAYKNVSDAISVEQTELANCEPGVQETYADQLEDLNSQLETIKASWEAETGNALVIAMQNKYEWMMQGVQEQLDTLTDEIAQEQEKQLTSNTAYADLKAELDALIEEFDRVKGEVEEFGLGEDTSITGSVETIQNLIDASSEALEEAREDFSLNENSTLTDADNIKTQIFRLEYHAYDLHKNALRNQASAALNAVWDALSKNVLDGSDFRAQYDELETRFSDNTLLNPSVGFTEESLEILKGMIEEYQAIAEEANALLEQIQENTFTLGDVDLNPDGQVTAVDVQILVGWVSEGMTYEQLYEQNKRQALAADITGDDKINIADVTAAINLAMGETTGQNRVNSFKAPMVQGNDNYLIAYMGEFDGCDRYAVAINNANDVVAGQFDIKLAPGMNLVRVETAERAADHSLVLHDSSANEARVVLFSMENAPIKGNGGAVAFIDVQGQGTLTIDDMLFADSYSRSYFFKPSGTTGIMDTLIDGAKDLKQTFYDAAGRAYDKIQRGLNIIRNSDGSVSKELH